MCGVFDKKLQICDVFVKLWSKCSITLSWLRALFGGLGGHLRYFSDSVNCRQTSRPFKVKYGWVYGENKQTPTFHNIY